MKMRSLLVAAVASLLAASAAPALTVAGVEVPARKTVDGKTLPLNGAGLRTVTLGFIPIKAYVAAFYAPAPLRTAAAVSASPGPLQFTFTFLQGVGQGQVTDAWNAQFRQSATFSYPGLAKDQAAFVKMFGPLAKFGVETVELAGDQTRVIDNGVAKGAITGTDFQKTFLSMWFGSNPVMPGLKSALLGK